MLDKLSVAFLIRLSIGYLTNSYPAIKLFFVVSNHSFHKEQSIKATITELDSN